MPTINPRVNVTLSPSLDALVSRLAGLQRASKSQVLRELLEAAEPGLQRAVTLMEAAEQVKAQFHEELGRSASRAVDKAEAHINRALSVVDGFSQDLVSAAEAVRPRRPARPGAARTDGTAAEVPNPPASNRGVKSGATGAGTGVHRSRVKRS